MKEIKASATPKKKKNRICCEQEQIYFSTLKLQNTNNDGKIVPKHMGQERNLATLSVLHSVHGTGSLHTDKMMLFRVSQILGENNGN